jgi:methyl-accepting chemotaxis protein
MDLQLFNRVRSRLVGAPIGLSLSIVLLLGLIPAVLMGYYYAQSSLANITLAQRELEGVELLRHIQPVESFITNPPDSAADQKRGAVNAANTLQQAMRHGGHAASFDSNKHFEAVQGKLRMIASGFETDPRPSFDSLVTRIGDQSGLILDPELESYYLMDIVLMKSRRLARAAHELEKVSALSSNARDQLLLISRHRVGDAARELQSAALRAIKGNADGTLQRSNLMMTINNTIMASNRMVSTGDINANYKALIIANKKSWIAAADALDRALNARIARVNANISSTLWICGGVLVLVMSLAGLVIAAITSGLRQISQRVDLMSLGDYTSEVPGIEYNNDIGVIAGALQHFVDMSGELDTERERAKSELEETVERIRLENEQLLAQALDQQLQSQKIEREAVARLAAGLEDQMSGLLAGSQAAAHQMSREADLMANSTSGVQREASAAALAASEIRYSVQAITPEVQAVAEQLQAYTTSLGDAKNIAQDAVKRVDIARQCIVDFDSATMRAGAMLEVIAKVARKTNMVALNASIEAVRVGEAGAGFMVVAEEVKALAQSTSQAAIEISSQIQAMEGANGAVASAFGDVLDIVNVLAAQSDSVASGMSNQASAINHVNDTISEASRNLSAMVGSIDSADKSASIAIERSSEMLAASNSVSASVGTLDKSVREFLGGLQSAQRQAA